MCGLQDICGCPQKQSYGRLIQSKYPHAGPIASAPSVIQCKNVFCQQMLEKKDSMASNPPTLLVILAGARLPLPSPHNRMHHASSKTLIPTKYSMIAASAEPSSADMAVAVNLPSQHVGI